MPGPQFVTTDNFTHAGLYIKERNPPATVRGATNQGVVGIAGACVKGPVDKLVEINSEQRFLEVFGGRDGGGGGALEGEVWKALLNKPFGKLFVVRAAAAAATTAEKDFNDGATPVINIAANSPGDHGNDVRITIQDATDGDANHFDLIATWNDRRQHFKNLDISAGQDNLASVIGTDDGNLVTATKLADGRPDNASDQALDDTTASDGSIADSDFTGTDGPIELLNGSTDVKVALVAGQSSSAVKAKINTEAAAAVDKLWLVCPDDDTVTASAAETEVGGLTRDDRLVYCFNHPYTLDPDTAAEIVTEPHAWMASAISQLDPDQHPGSKQTRAFLAGITRLTYTNISPTQYGDFRAAGISALEKRAGYQFVDAVTTDLTPGLEEIARRRMADFLVESIADFLAGSVKEPNTQSRRLGNKAAIETFLRGLWRQERYVDFAEDGESPGFVVDIESLNTAAQRAAGVEKILVRVKLIGFMIFLVLETEIGFSVKVTEVQQAA